MMTYEEAFHFLFSLNNLPRNEYLSPRKRKNGWYLKRLQLLLDLLGNPEKKIPHYIHITGTSGKGSTSLMLSGILRQDGKKVGLLTSPHPSIITERWEVDGKIMPKKDFVRIVKIIKEKLDVYAVQSPYDLPSFFEIVTAMGIYYFAEKKVDWGVIEVGLGGRNDSTNIIPYTDIAVITHIAEDHLELIGPTKKEVAKEKSGIIKNGCLVYTMEKDPEILKIIARECKKQQVPLQPVDRTQYELLQENLSGVRFNYKNKKFQLCSLGTHQIENAILVIEICKSLGIAETTIAKGLKNSLFPLRLEVVKKNPIVILDGAHNPDKMNTTVKGLKKIMSDNKNKKLSLIIGFSHNKDIKPMLKKLLSLKPQTVYCTRSTVNPVRKVADPVDLKKQIDKYYPQGKTKITLDPQVALKWGLENAGKNGILLITGSVFLSGELRPHFKNV